AKMTTQPTRPSWQPKPIDIEAEFTKFVPTFRSGRIVRDLLPNQPAMVLNADYFFPDDGIVVELKTMEKDSSEPMLFAERLVRSYQHLGYTGSDVIGYLFRGEAMPIEVAAQLKLQLANPLRQAIRKANKQNAATKRLLRIENGYGLVVFANDKNFGLRP